MSPSDDTPLRNNFSHTEHSSGSIPRPNFFDPLPDELIIHTLSFPPLLAIIRFASTSRRHRSIASAEQIWFPIALDIVKGNVDPNDTLVDEEFMRSNCNRFLAALGLSVTDPTQAWYRIATTLLEQVEWTLGWWLGRASTLAKGCLWRIFIDIDETDSGDDEQDDRFFRVIATEVEVVENREYNLLLQPGGPLRTGEPAAGISSLRLPREYPWTSANVVGFVPLVPRLVARGSLFGCLSLNSQDPVDTNSPWYSARKLQDHLPHRSLGTDSWQRMGSRPSYVSFSGAPYPPPSLSQLLDHREVQHTSDSPLVPSIALLPMAGAGTTKKTLLSIHRPSSFSKHLNELVHPGIYVAPFSVHGWEYLLVRVRELTDDDFQATWPWEGSMAVAPSDTIRTTHYPFWDSLHNHLGPFSAVLPCSPISPHPIRVSRDHVRRGSRVLEGIKIKGDENVPGGQRSFIAFLDDPLVRPEALEAAEETLPEVSSEREDVLPWPYVSQPPTTTDPAAYTQTYFSPERGIDVPGVIRVAHSNFSYPQWANCVIHVECKTKFTLAFLGAMGIVFRKLNDWGV